MTLLERLNQFLDSIRHDSTCLPALDKTMPNYNFRSYLECCESLNRPASITKYVIYNTYWKDKFGEKQ